MSSVARFVPVEDFWQDARHALRTLARTPGFAAVAIATLALGIGATTAIFSVVHALREKPLPFAEAHRLVRLVVNVPADEAVAGRPRRSVSGLTGAELVELRQRTEAFSEIAIHGLALMTVTAPEGATRLEGAWVSPSIFQLLGVRPLAGRSLDERDEAGPAIVLGYAAWQRHFGGSLDVVGRTLMLEDSLVRLDRTEPTTYTIAGVMPRGFEFPTERTQFWIPFARAASGGTMIGRLAGGVSIEAASAEVDAALRAMRKPDRSYELAGARDELVAPLRPSLRVLAGAVGFVLLIACVNVASLLLARTASRRRELAIRIALGAGPGRLMRQLLAESLVLAIPGGIGGVILAAAGIRLLRSLVATLARVDLGPLQTLPRVEEVGLDPSVLAFATIASIVSGVAFGLAPAIAVTRADPREALGDERGARGGAGVAGARGLLVAAEIAMATMLLVGSGLPMRSFITLANVDPGYDPSHTVTFQVALPPLRYPEARLRTLAEDLVARLHSIPGVQAAAYANQVPMVALQDSFPLRERPEPATAAPGAPRADARLVSRDYPAAMGIRVVAGRGFTERDGAGQPRVLLVNEALARRDFAGDALGRLVYVGADSIPWQIVGIVADVRQFRLDRPPEPQFFADLRQWPGGPVFPIGAYYVVRASTDPAAVLSSARAIARQLDDQAGLFNVATMDEVVASTIWRPRLYAVLLGIFATIAVALAAVGVYGTMAGMVTLRTREIGIRTALGARRRDVLGLVMRRGIAQTVAGITAGLGGSALVTRYLQGMLFGVTPLDATTFIAVPVAFASVAMLAAYVPARRAATVDPLVALRHS
jgi:predicted permease